METTHPTPTAEALKDILREEGAKMSRDGKSVVVGLGHAGYIRVTPDWVISGGSEVQAARVEAPRGFARRRDEIAAALRAGGIYPTF